MRERHVFLKKEIFELNKISKFKHLDPFELNQILEDICPRPKSNIHKYETKDYERIIKLELKENIQWMKSIKRLTSNNGFKYFHGTYTELEGKDPDAIVLIYNLVSYFLFTNDESKLLKLLKAKIDLGYNINKVFRFLVFHNSDVGLKLFLDNGYFGKISNQEVYENLLSIFSEGDKKSFELVLKIFEGNINFENIKNLNDFKKDLFYKVFDQVSNPYLFTDKSLRNNKRAQKKILDYKLEVLDFCFEKEKDKDEIFSLKQSNILHKLLNNRALALSTKKTLIKYLLDRHLDLNKKDENGDTALMVLLNYKFGDYESFSDASVSKDNLELLKFMIKNGANIYLRNKEGKSLLSYVLKIPLYKEIRDYMLYELKVDFK